MYVYVSVIFCCIRYLQTNLSAQVEYKKDEGSFLLFEVQMLHLATVVSKQ